MLRIAWQIQAVTDQTQLEVWSTDQVNCWLKPVHHNIPIYKSVHLLRNAICPHLFELPQGIQELKFHFRSHFLRDNKQIHQSQELTDHTSQDKLLDPQPRQLWEPTGILCIQENFHPNIHDREWDSVKHRRESLPGALPERPLLSVLVHNLFCFEDSRYDPGCAARGISSARQSQVLQAEQPNTKMSPQQGKGTTWTRTDVCTLLHVWPLS